jgi:hypothetical protein
VRPLPYLHGYNSSSARRSVWRLRSTDVPYARSMPSPKMNSFVILATNTQIFCGRHPRVSGKIPSRWEGFPQIPSAACNGSSTVFRAIRRRCQAWPVTYALVSKVKRHGLSQTQSLCDQAMVGLFRNDSQRVKGGGLCIRRRPPFSAGPRSFPDGWAPLLSASLLLLESIRAFSAVPMCLSEALRYVSGTGHHFLPPFRKSSYAGSDLALHCSSMPIVLRLFARWERSAPPNCPGARFVAPGA